MPTDEERRAVARRLREIRPCKSGHIEWWTIAKALDLKESAGWFGWEKFEPDSVNRLADLIEPSEPEVKCVAEVKVDGERLEKLVHDAAVKLTGIDRDALLALADEMEGEKSDISCATCRADFGLACYDYKPNATCMEACLRYYARRIRKALGVQDA